MMVDFNDYECFDPGVNRPLGQVTISEARKHYNFLMLEKQKRIAQLSALVGRSNVCLNGSDESIQMLNNWFFENVEPSETEPSRLKPIWYSVVNDIALFLGDEIIKRAPKLKWELYIWGKKNLSYQRPVIMGFTKVTNLKYNIDLDWAIGTYGHRIVANNEGENDLFVRIVHAAVEKA